jgi:hypothetical protein
MGSSMLPGATAVLKATFGSALLSLFANSPRSTDRERDESSKGRISLAFRKVAMGSSTQSLSTAGVTGVVLAPLGAAVRARNAFVIDIVRP